MKNIFRIVMAVAILFTASCAKEDISSTIGGGEVEVTFTADLGQLGTRTYGLAENVDRVYLGVYEAGEKNPLQLVDYQKGYPVNDGKASITVVLLKDKKYDLVFWAQNNAQTCYNVVWDERTLDVDYDGALSQDDKRDAFFLIKNGFRAGHDETTFELRRPFAQLRAGINQKDFDYIKANGVTEGLKKSAAKVYGVANVLNLVNGNVAGEETVTFNGAPVPNPTDPTDEDAKFAVNGENFYQISMNYILVNEKKLVDVEYNFSDGKTDYFRSYYNVPIQRNYRTNILGQLISSPMDFNVIIAPEFDGDNVYEVTPWDGKSVSEPEYDAATKTYTVSNGAELAWIAQTVNGTSTTAANPLEGQTIILANDIDLGNYPWTPIGSAKNDHGFMANFDGNGHAVKNLNISNITPDADGYVYAGLFGVTEGTAANHNKIENLIIENVNINVKGDIAAAAVAYPYYTDLHNITVKGKINIVARDYTAGVVSYTRRCVVASNLTIAGDEGSVISGRRTVGGVISDIQMNGGLTAQYTNFNASGLKITAEKSVGGISGIIGQNLNGATVKNVQIVCDDIHKGKVAGSFSNNKPVITDLVVENVTGAEFLVGANYDQKVDTIIVINGKEYIYKGNGTYLVDGVYETSTIEGLQNILNNAAGETVINLVADLNGDVTVAQSAGVKITINGNNHNYKGVIVVDGKSATYTTAALTINNVNFNAEEISADACINLGAKGNNNTRYTCNVKVDGCTFDVPGAVGVKSYTGGDKNLTISNSTATAKAHSLLQAKGIDGILVEGCEIKSKNGLNFNNSTNVTVEQCVADVKGYAVRFGEGSAANGASETYTIENSTLKSACEEAGDAVIVLRGTADKAVLNLVNTTLDGAIQIDNQANAVVKINGVTAVTSSEGLKAALNADVATITLAPATFEGTFTVNKNVTISSAYADNKATIKGRVNIGSNASGVTFENIKFDINSASAAKNTFSGASYKYPAIVTIYAAATNFEGCEFKCDISKGVCGINYGQHSAGNKLVVNNCKFTGDFYAIRTRTLFSITNSIFDVYTTQGQLAAVWTWGNGTTGTKLDSGANTVVFTGNTNLNDNEVYGVQLTSTTFNYCHISYNFQNNSGFTTLANSLNSNCDYTGKNFAEGSETF